MIPASNVDDLMLRRDVIQAVAEGKFFVIPVCTVDEGIQVLTGIPAGEPVQEGRFPEGTVNGLVDRRLAELAKGMKDFGTSAGNDHQ
jgi:predicted ATP-dependent protease